MTTTDSLIVPPAMATRCSLCWIDFRLGDEYTTVWPRGEVGRVELALVAHPACLAQLDGGDLTRIFEALRQRLALVLNAVNGSGC